MITDTDLYVLAHVNSGFRSDVQKLHDLDASLERLIDEAKTFPGVSSPLASSDWQSLAAGLRAIRRHVQLIDEALVSGAANPREDWKSILQHDAQVEAALLRVRNSGGATLPPDRQEHWNDLWRTIFLQMATLRAHAAMAQARAEMREHYGQAKADQMAQEVLRHLPENSNIAEATHYADGYRQALTEYQDNKENLDGFFGIVRALLMISDEDPGAVARRRMANIGRTDAVEV